MNAFHRRMNHAVGCVGVHRRPVSSCRAPESLAPARDGGCCARDAAHRPGRRRTPSGVTTAALRRTEAVVGSEKAHGRTGYRPFPAGRYPLSRRGRGPMARRHSPSTPAAPSVGSTRRSVRSTTRAVGATARMVDATVPLVRLDGLPGRHGPSPSLLRGESSSPSRTRVLPRKHPQLPALGVVAPSPAGPASSQRRPARDGSTRVLRPRDRAAQPLEPAGAIACQPPRHRRPVLMGSKGPEPSSPRRPSCVPWAALERRIPCPLCSQTSGGGFA